MSESNNKSLQSQNDLESDDFISFSSPNRNNFKPVNSSSPQKAWEPHNNYKKNWNNRKFSGNTSFMTPPNNSRNRSYNSPYNYNKRYNSPNQSFNNSYRSDQSFNSSKDTSTSEVDINRYLHPSFMEDPWKRLEELRASKGELEVEALNLTKDLSSSKSVEV